jgi:uncharacterized membrane protein YphA (DoxX/SURF4 family)
MNLLLWILRLVAAVIMLQTLYFKFSASEESVYIFTVLKMEPLGRIGIGVAELIASILLLIPATTFYGAMVGAGLMAGAIFSHIMQLGIEVKNDGGQLFLYAIIVLLCCVTLAYLKREQLFELWKR